MVQMRTSKAVTKTTHQPKSSSPPLYIPTSSPAKESVLGEVISKAIPTETIKQALNGEKKLNADPITFSKTIPFTTVSSPLSLVKAATEVEALCMSNTHPEDKERKKSHPRIKYSGLKNLAKEALEAGSLKKDLQAPLNLPDSAKDGSLHLQKSVEDSHETPLNLDKLFPHVMAAGSQTSFSTSHVPPQLTRSMSLDAEDHYADIDDIELPDGSQIGYSTDMSAELKRFLPQPVTNPIMPILNEMPLHLIHQHHHHPSMSHFNRESDWKLPLADKSSNHASAFSDDGELTPSQCGDESLEIYGCRHCGKRYRWKSTLRRHVNDECGDKKPAHECPYCPYKAKQRGNLGVHVRKHHGHLPQLESRRKKRSSY